MNGAFVTRLFAGNKMLRRGLPAKGRHFYLTIRVDQANMHSDTPPTMENKTGIFMSIAIRTAQLDDLNQISQLFDGYRVYYKQPADIEKARRFISQRLEKQDSTIFVAEDESGSLVGFVQLYPIFSSVSARQSLLLNDLFVSKSVRRSGVARQLMNRAASYAKEEACCWLMLQTENTNEKAQALYESLGYKQDTECRYYYLGEDRF